MTDLNKERELELFNAFVEKNLPELFEKHSNGNFFAANFGAPNKDPELLETELTIAWFDEAHSGSGYYVYISEYPEEGAMKLESESGAEG